MLAVGQNTRPIHKVHMLVFSSARLAYLSAFVYAPPAHFCPRLTNSGTKKQKNKLKFYAKQ